MAGLFLAAREASMPYLPARHTDVETRWWVANRVLGGLLLEHVIARHEGELLLRVFQRSDRARRSSERHGFALVDVDDGSRDGEREPDSTHRLARRAL